MDILIEAQVIASNPDLYDRAVIESSERFIKNPTFENAAALCSLSAESLGLPY